MNPIHVMNVHLFLNRDLTAIYAVAGMRAFTITLIGIFVPIYMLQIGYKLEGVLWYNVTWILAYAICIPLSSVLGTKVGLRQAMMLSAPFLAAHFYFLSELAVRPEYILPVALTYALSQLFYWPAFHIDFIRSSNLKHMGAEVGTLNALLIAVNALGPLLAGILIVWQGYNVLFYLALVLILISPLPLVFSRERYEPFEMNLLHIFHRTNTKNFLAFYAEGVINTAEIILWPIFIFLAIGNIIIVGGIGTLMLLLGSAFVFIIGRASDKISKKKILIAGSLITSFTWFIRNSFAGIFSLSFISALSGAAQATLLIPYNAIFYSRAAKTRTGEFVAFREFSVHLGRATVLLVLYVFSWKWTFLFSGYASLAFLPF